MKKNPLSVLGSKIQNEKKQAKGINVKSDFPFMIPLSSLSGSSDILVTLTHIPLRGLPDSSEQPPLPLRKLSQMEIMTPGLNSNSSLPGSFCLALGLICVTPLVDNYFKSLELWSGLCLIHSVLFSVPGAQRNTCDTDYYECAVLFVGCPESKISGKSKMKKEVHINRVPICQEDVLLSFF